MSKIKIEKTILTQENAKNYINKKLYYSHKFGNFNYPATVIFSDKNNEYYVYDRNNVGHIIPEKETNNDLVNIYFDIVEEENENNSIEINFSR